MDLGGSRWATGAGGRLRSTGQKAGLSSDWSHKVSEERARVRAPALATHHSRLGERGSARGRGRGSAAAGVDSSPFTAQDHDQGKKGNQSSKRAITTTHMPALHSSVSSQPPHQSSFHADLNFPPPPSASPSPIVACVPCSPNNYRLLLVLYASTSLSRRSTGPSKSPALSSPLCHSAPCCLLTRFIADQSNHCD